MGVFSASRRWRFPSDSQPRTAASAARA